MTKSMQDWIDKVSKKHFTTDGFEIYCLPCQSVINVQKLFQLKQHVTTSKHKKNVILFEAENQHENFELEEMREPELELEECCANCMLPCDTSSDRDPHFLTAISSTSPAEALYTYEQDLELQMEVSQDEKLIFVTIPEALKLIYGFTFRSKLIHQKLTLCRRCNDHLSELYRLFCAFRDLCHEDSYINMNKVEHRADMKVGPGTNLNHDKPEYKPARTKHIKARKSEMIVQRKSPRTPKPRILETVLDSTSESEPETNEENDTIIEDTINQSRTKVDDNAAGFQEADYFNEAGDFFDPVDVDTDETTEAVAQLHTPSATKLRKLRLRNLKLRFTGSQESKVFSKNRTRLANRKEIKKSKTTRKRKGSSTVHKCDVCGKEARNNWNLQLHIRGVHQGIRSYHCVTCKAGFSSKILLETHVRIKHNGESSQFICPEPGCGRAYAYPAGLRVHLMKHTGDAQFSCDICHKRFRRTCDLKDHMPKHSNEKPFICEICGCSFKTSSNLKKHRVLHEERQGFTCSICNKPFMTDWNLRLHIKAVHEKVTPYKCPICPKAFSSSSNLKVHLAGLHKCPKDNNNKIILPPLLPMPTTPSEGSSEYIIPDQHGEDQHS